MPRVLIADDNSTLREALKNILVSRDGWVIAAEASNGAEAVELAATSEPDVILLDFQMPVMNGLDAAKKIIAKNPAIPVAMYTLHQGDFFESQAKAVGVRKVILKTDLFSALSTSLHELVDRRAGDTQQTRKPQKKKPKGTTPRRRPK
ncbi:MAG TPA: response regulator transcription factor [Terriglobales bacterium]|nr:response regulator transcription factor [Terriglobales bacterium]